MILTQRMAHFFQKVGMTRLIVTVVFFFFLTSCFADPRELVDVTTEKLMKELQSKESKIKQDKVLGQAIVLKHVEPIFDFIGMARFSFGRPWKDATDPQKRRVVESLKKIWLQQYTDNMLEYLNAEIKTIPGTKGVYGKKTMVRSVVNHNNNHITIDYRMWEQSSGWKIYDVLVDGISLLINYRDQLSEYHQNHSIEEAVVMLEGKVRH